MFFFVKYTVCSDSHVLECGGNVNFYTTVYSLATLQSEFFQDDVFPDTIVSWEPALTAKQWLEGKNGQNRTISLKPEGMTPCEVDVGVALGVWVVGVDLGVGCGWIWVCGL